MNLLGAKLYDPGTAASKATTSLLAMTAIDTTNLRISFTVPAHGFVRVRMACVHTGSTTIAQVLLGILEGSTMRARVACNVNLLQTAVATSQTMLFADFTVAGLSAGAVNWDAAYGVEVVASANGAIKYGGPNDTTTNNAWGAFVFEVWDPQPLTTGLGGGVNTTQISGDTTAADNAEAFFDGTGYAGTGNTIPNVTTVTNLTNAATAGDLTATMKASVNTEADTALSDYGPLKPTVAARTLDVSAGGEAGVDWANVGGQSTAVNLSATTTNLVNTVTTYTGNTVQTGDSFTRLGAPAGVSVSADVAAVKAQTAAIETDTAEIGVAGAGLTALGDARLANLDAAVTSRAAAATALSTAQWTNGRAAALDNLDALISSRMATFVYTAPDNAGIAAIQLQTDKFTFTVANIVDSNIHAVNDITVTGSGTGPDPWGP